MKNCFYCGALTNDKGGDHFPIPENCGGKETVPCCESCHDMKDRYSLDNWPHEWVSIIIEDMPRLKRETKLFLARTIRICAEAMRRQHAKL